VPGAGRVIVGVSGSPASLRALRLAEHLARSRGADLVPVLAWTPPGGDRADRSQPSPELRRMWREAACKRLQDALAAAWGEEPSGLAVLPMVERGHAGRVLTILASAPDDVLVVGAGRRGALGRIRCTVCRYCIAHARCPVVLVPPPELARDARRLRLAWTLRRRALTAEEVLRHGNPGQSVSS
jgi:nucleotide-binding universal stress UspA family protein